MTLNNGKIGRAAPRRFVYENWISVIVGHEVGHTNFGFYRGHETERRKKKSKSNKSKAFVKVVFRLRFICFLRQKEKFYFWF